MIAAWHWWHWRRRHRRPVRLWLALPEIRTKDGKMANFQLSNDEIVTIPILALDAAGAVVPAPSGDVFTVVSSNPASLNAVIGATSAGNPAVVINALVQVSPGLSFTVSDSAGLAVDVVAVDIVQDTAPKAVGLDFSNTTNTPQPVPTNPGP